MYRRMNCLICNFLLSWYPVRKSRQRPNMDRAGNCKQSIHAHDPGSRTTGNQSKLKLDTRKPFTETMPTQWHRSFFGTTRWWQWSLKLFMEVKWRNVESEVCPRQQYGSWDCIIELYHNTPNWKTLSFARLYWWGFLNCRVPFLQRDSEITPPRSIIFWHCTG